MTHGERGPSPGARAHAGLYHGSSPGLWATHAVPKAPGTLPASLSPAGPQDEQAHPLRSPNAGGADTRHPLAPFRRLLSQPICLC